MTLGLVTDFKEFSTLKRMLLCPQIKTIISFSCYMGLINSPYFRIKFHVNNLEDRTVIQTLEFSAIFGVISNIADSVSSVGEQKFHV